MTLLDFITHYNKIKPSKAQVEATIPKNLNLSVEDIYVDFDLQITSVQTHDNVILDLLSNTNITEISFSVFNFYNENQAANLMYIANIEEKGDLYLNAKKQTIDFEPDGIAASELFNEEIEQDVFLKLLLKYWERYFNQVFRKNTQGIQLSEINIDLALVQSSLFKKLLAEWD